MYSNSLGLMVNSYSVSSTGKLSYLTEAEVVAKRKSLANWEERQEAKRQEEWQQEEKRQQEERQEEERQEEERFWAKRQKAKRQEEGRLERAKKKQAEKEEWENALEELMMAAKLRKQRYTDTKPENSLNEIMAINKSKKGKIAKTLHDSPENLAIPSRITGGAVTVQLPAPTKEFDRDVFLAFIRFFVAYLRGNSHSQVSIIGRTADDDSVANYDEWTAALVSIMQCVGEYIQLREKCWDSIRWSMDHNSRHPRILLFEALGHILKTLYCCCFERKGAKAGMKIFGKLHDESMTNTKIWKDLIETTKRVRLAAQAVEEPLCEKMQRRDELAKQKAQRRQNQKKTTLMIKFEQENPRNGRRVG
jgi:hypothetical protein